MTPAELKHSRKALGLSAEGFARAVGVESGRTVRRWESGDRDIPGPVKMLVLLAFRIASVKEALITKSRS